MSRGLVARALATVALSCTALVGVGVVAAPSYADEVDVPPSLTAGARGESATQVYVPAGVTPTAVVGTLAVSGADGGRVEFTVEGRVVRRITTFEASGTRVTLPVRAGDAANGSITIGVRYRYPEVDRCGYLPPDIVVDLTDLALRYTGTPASPTTVGRFLGPAVTGVDVVVPDNPTDDVAEAALTAVTALASRYAAPIPVTLVRDGAAPTRTLAGHRVVVLQQGAAGAVAARLTAGTVPTLTLSGQGDDLVEAARALGVDELGLAAAAEAEELGLTEPLDATGDEGSDGSDADTSLTLADFTTAQALRLGGWGVSRAYVGLEQDRFDGPVSGFDLHLEGAHSVVRRSDVRMDVYVNNQLVSSELLDEDPDLVLDLDVPADVVNPVNGLELVLNALPECDENGYGTEVPPVVDVDTSRSTVVATRGRGETAGFALFPQVLGHRVPVAVHSLTVVDGGDQLAQAAGLLTAMQRVATEPLTVDLVDARTLVDANDSGLLVGATADDTQALQAPLRLEQVRLIDFQEATYRLGDDARYAALQVVQDHGRRLLVLGGWTPDQAALGARLTDRLVDYVDRVGWSGLDEDLLVMAADNRPFMVSTRTLLPQDERVEEARGWVWWLVAGIALLVLLVVLQLLLRSSRNRRVRDLIRAQQAEEAELEERRRLLEEADAGSEADGRP
ncbi:MAG: hypothetical protein CMH83_18115 [Nocardioides sp.]|nr:hypothetical protein [Nocardioides sp.]